MMLFFLFLSACSSADITVLARTQGSTVHFEIDEISLRRSDQAWFDDWDSLKHLTEIELDSEWQEIGWLPMVSEEQEYHHIFLDADRIFHNGEEIKDIVEPTSLGGRFSRGTIKLELEVIEAPDGIGLFLISAN